MSLEKQYQQEVSSEKKRKSKTKEDKLVDTIWETLVKPLLDIAVEKTQMPIKDLILRLVDSGITLGYLAKVYKFENYLKKFGNFLKMFKEMAKSATPEEVNQFVDYIVNTVLPRKDPILADLFKRDQKTFEWFRQSIFELWQMFRGD